MLSYFNFFIVSDIHISAVDCVYFFLFHPLLLPSCLLLFSTFLCVFTAYFFFFLPLSSPYFLSITLGHFHFPFFPVSATHHSHLFLILISSISFHSPILSGSHFLLLFSPFIPSTRTHYVRFLSHVFFIYVSSSTPPWNMYLFSLVFSSCISSLFLFSFLSSSFHSATTPRPNMEGANHYADFSLAKRP